MREFEKEKRRAGDLYEAALYTAWQQLCNLWAPVEQGNAKLVIPVESSRSACSGAVTAYLMRRLAARAGAYAPGIQEHLFFQIGQRPIGANLDSLESWLRSHGGVLTDLGYYIMQRRIAAPTDALGEWVQDGKGYRAAVLSVDGRALYNGDTRSEGDAVGLTLHDATSGIADGALPGDVPSESLVMIDPWPGVSRVARPPRSLDLAHRAHKYAALLLYWSGYG